MFSRAQAFRKLALKTHPDKRPASEREAAEKEFDALQKAYDVLSDADARQALDDVLRATAVRRAAHAARDAKRKRAVEDLEARERAAAGSSGALSDEQKARERLRVELARLRKQREGSRRYTPGMDEDNVASTAVEVPEHLYRSLKAVWRRDDDSDASAYSAKKLRDIFETFGTVEDVVLREGKKKKGSALVVFATIDACVAASNATSGDLSNPLVVTRAAIPAKSTQGAATSVTKPADSTHAEKPKPAAPVSAANKDFESIVLERMKRAQERARLVAEAEAEE